MTRRGYSAALTIVALIVSGVVSSARASTTVPSGQVFACGTGTTATTVGVSAHGNIVRFESPAGIEHLFGGASTRSGYKLCYSSGGPFTAAFDFGGTEGGWGAAAPVSQPNGPNTFPLEISRTTADGSVTLTRRITGNSFVGPAPTGGTFDTGNFNGVGCDSLEECGNCTNRTIHVLTRLTNHTGAPLTVRIVELADFQISATATNDRFIRTTDSVAAFEDLSDAGADTASRGMLVQTLIVPALTGVQPSGGFGTPGVSDCAIATVATPTAPGNFEGALSQELVIGPGSTISNSIRLHYRRY